MHAATGAGGRPCRLLVLGAVGSAGAAGAWCQHRLTLCLHTHTNCVSPPPSCRSHRCQTLIPTPCSHRAGPPVDVKPASGRSREQPSSPQPCTTLSRSSRCPPPRISSTSCSARPSAARLPSATMVGARARREARREGTAGGCMFRSGTADSCAECRRPCSPLSFPGRPFYLPPFTGCTLGHAAHPPLHMNARSPRSLLLCVVASPPPLHWLQAGPSSASASSTCAR